jgi:hypothetical protein
MGAGVAVEPGSWGRQDALDPQEHAAVILEVCGGNLREAQNICRSNLLLGDPEKANYWRTVLRALNKSANA